MHKLRHTTFSNPVPPQLVHRLTYCYSSSSSSSSFAYPSTWGVQALHVMHTELHESAHLLKRDGGVMVV
jgi:hypothetical protein